MHTCYRCGGPADIEIEGDGSAICEACEDDYQAAMRATYPYGQCHTCGAEYRPITCPLGVTHVVAFHSEGGCGQWRDYGDVEDGECAYGCRPAFVAPAPVAAANDPWLATLRTYVEAHRPADDDDLPF